MSYNLSSILPADRSKAIDILVEGLLMDGGHHKQYYIEEALKSLGVDLVILRKYLRTEDYDWDDGIP